MGSFNPDDGAVTGTRCDGRIPPGQAIEPGRRPDLDYPQERRAYGAIVRWARDHRGEGYDVRQDICL